MDLGSGGMKLQSSKMAQHCSIPLTILQDSATDGEEKSSPHASARSATDEWLKGLEGRWQSRIYDITESQTDGRVIILPFTFHSSFSPDIALLTYIYLSHYLLRKSLTFGETGFFFCFLANSKMRGSVPIPYLFFKYEATARRRLAIIFFSFYFLFLFSFSVKKKIYCINPAIRTQTHVHKQALNTCIM